MTGSTESANALNYADLEEKLVVLLLAISICISEGHLAENKFPLVGSLKKKRLARQDKFLGSKASESLE